MSRRKFTPGQPITTLEQFGAIIQAGRHFYLHGKFQHNGWARGWQVGWLLREVGAGSLRVADPVEVPDER